MNPLWIRSKLSISRQVATRLLLISFLFLPALTLLGQAPGSVHWTVVGPPGGDARAFAAVPGQPNHLYLGTTKGWVYETLDGGNSWRRLAKINSDGPLVLDNIIVDEAHPDTIFVGAWRLDHNGGGLWASRDGGKTWSEVAGLHGQSIRSLAQAPSDPQILVAGTLEGVYRSTDEGATWQLISPPGSTEVHEVESLAINPVNPEIIYAGTWHLPWKTTDGGKNWHNIKNGVIDDSDVFSIIIDPDKPKVVYASACSGIYKSENGGELFHKIQGIPAEARRTRVLMQDPSNHEIVYAGTTEGLYKTVDGGRNFKLMTSPDLVLNDVYVDPKAPDHLLLATDRAGVLSSQDGGVTFTSSSEGFSQRKLGALLTDREHPDRLYAGIVNDKGYGGVFASMDGGRAWAQVDAVHQGGLEGRDVFSLAQSADGIIFAGTSHGIFALEEATAESPQPQWQPRNNIVNTVTKISTETHQGRHINVEKQVKEQAHLLDGRIAALNLDTDTWLATTDLGLYTSRDKGASWQGGPVLNEGGFLSVAAHGELLVAARADGLVYSNDAGQTWWAMGIPTVLTRIHCITFSTDGTLWLGAREGVYFTRDGGKTWLWVDHLPLTDLDDVYFDRASGRVLVSSQSSDQVFAIDPKSLAWNWFQTGFKISLIRAAGGHLLAASVDDGVVVEPSTPPTRQAAASRPAGTESPAK